MGFLNPITSIDSVKYVTASVPSLSRDSWYWPCISGETFPPTLSNASYTDNGAYPGILVNSGGVHGSVTWSKMPRQSYTGKNVLTLSLKLWLTGAAPQLTRLGFLNKAYMDWAGDSAAGTATVFPPFSSTPIPALGSNVMNLIQISLSPAATTFSMNGAVVATLAPVETDQIVLTPFIAPIVGNSNSPFVSQLALDYVAA